MLSKKHKKCLKRILVYYNLNENDGRFLSQWEIEFLFRRMQNKT